MTSSAQLWLSAHDGTHSPTPGAEPEWENREQDGGPHLRDMLSLTQIT